MTLVSQMRGTPPTHVVRMRTALTVGPKPTLLSRHRATAGLAVGLRARVLPTGKFPPLAPLRQINVAGQCRLGLGLCEHLGKQSHHRRRKLEAELEA